MIYTITAQLRMPFQQIINYSHFRAITWRLQMGFFENLQIAVPLRPFALFLLYDFDGNL